MSNEHLSQLGQSAVDQAIVDQATVDQAFDEDGSDIDDDGPLDPSVFFGLFDDLADDADPEPAPEREFAETHDDSANDEPAGCGELTTIEAEAPDEPTTDEANLPGEATIEEMAPATISWWPTASEEPATNGGTTSVSSPPPIPADIDSPVGDADLEEPVGDADLEEPVEQARSRVDDRTGGGGTMAKVTLAAIAISLFAGLVVAFVFSLRNPDPAVSESVAGAADGGDPAASTIIEEPPSGLAGAIITGNQPTAELLTEEFASVLAAAVAGRGDLTSLRFEPGTIELDDRSRVVITELGAQLAEQPTVPVTISVRTFTEQSPAGNLALSIDQADALAVSLAAAGADPNQIRVRGLGAAPLSQAQPVPNFVALTPDFGDFRLGETLEETSPFTFGVPATATAGAWPLRPDGLLAVGAPADALTAYPDATVGAAGYSFLPPSEAGIRAEAAAAADALAEFLVAAYGVDKEQISTITPGSAVFVPTPDHGNHIWLQTGPASQGAFDVASIDPATVSFESGSAELDATGLNSVQELAEILTAGGATIVVDVRSYEAGDATADLALSEARRDALAEALSAAGVAPEQLRMHASGASSHLLDDGGPTVTITVAP